MWWLCVRVSVSVSCGERVRLSGCAMGRVACAASDDRRLTAAAAGRTACPAPRYLTSGPVRSVRALLDKHVRPTMTAGLGIASQEHLAANAFREVRLFHAAVDHQLRGLKNVLHALFEMCVHVGGGGWALLWLWLRLACACVCVAVRTMRQCCDCACTHTLRHYPPPKAYHVPRRSPVRHVRVLLLLCSLRCRYGVAGTRVALRSPRTSAVSCRTKSSATCCTTAAS